MDDLRHFVAVIDDVAPHGIHVEARCWYDANAAAVSHFPNQAVKILSEAEAENHPALQEKPLLRAHSPHRYDVLDTKRDLPIVAFVGEAGSGKDTAADLLVAECGFVKIAFADVLKRFVAETLRIPEANLWGPSELRNIAAGPYRVVAREALQLLGTEWGRRLYDDVWAVFVACIIQRLQRENVTYSATRGVLACSRKERPLGVVLSDLRFLNERDIMRNTFGERYRTVRISRPGSGLRGKAGKHQSELEQQKILADFRIDNDGSLEVFRERVLVYAKRVSEAASGGA